MSAITGVVETSDIIKQATLTKEKVGHLKRHHKELLVKKHFHEGAECGNNYRLPTKCKDFKAFGRKTDFVKDAALTMVIEMCDICCRAKLTEEETEKVDERHNKMMEEKRKV